MANGRRQETATQCAMSEICEKMFAGVFRWRDF